MFWLYLRLLFDWLPDVNVVSNTSKVFTGVSLTVFVETSDLSSSVLLESISTESRGDLWDFSICVAPETIFSMDIQWLGFCNGNTNETAWMKKCWYWLITLSFMLFLTPKMIFYNLDIISIIHMMFITNCVFIWFRRPL